jgi:hypothetical protein
MHEILMIVVIRASVRDIGPGFEGLEFLHLPCLIPFMDEHILPKAEYAERIHTRGLR